MPDESLPRILCVDDEPRVVKGLALHLHSRYEVLTAHGGAEALEKLKAAAGAAVVISDMRMPGMDGAVLLARVRELYPETTRVLLTGEAGRDPVVSAVNQGQIFRFLTKPCPAHELTACVAAAVEQNRLVAAERVLLQQTLVGCIHSLVDVLALTNPVAFGRASRLRRQAMAFAQHLGCARGFWQLDAAAMLSQVGYLSLPAELVERVYDGGQLTAEEQLQVQAVPEVASKLLNHIPRLEPVTQILRALNYSATQLARLDAGPVGTGARILRLVTELDALTSRGNSPDTAIGLLLSRAQQDGGNLVQEFADYLGASTEGTQVSVIPLREVRAGMTLLQDLRSDRGTLLVAGGSEITERFMERIRNFGPAMLNGKVDVRLPQSPDVRGIAASGK